MLPVTTFYPYLYLLFFGYKSSDIRHVISDGAIPDARSHCNFMSDTITDITYDRSQLTYTQLCGHDLKDSQTLKLQPDHMTRPWQPWTTRHVANFFWRKHYPKCKLFDKGFFSKVIAPLKLTVDILHPQCQATINDKKENHRQKINGQDIVWSRPYGSSPDRI